MPVRVRTNSLIRRQNVMLPLLQHYEVPVGTEREL